MKLKIVAFIFIAIAIIVPSYLYIKTDAELTRAEKEHAYVVAQYEYNEKMYDEFLDWLIYHEVQFDSSDEDQLAWLWIYFLYEKFGFEQVEEV